MHACMHARARVLLKVLKFMYIDTHLLFNINNCINSDIKGS